jgi:transcriptional regulator with XRE-family HTH domain
MTDNEIIRSIRVQLGFTQKEFGRRLHITQGAISHWERGLAYPSITIATKIAKMAEKKGLYFSPKQLRGDHG